MSELLELRPPLVIYHKQLGDILMLEPALTKLALTTQTKVMLATRPSFDPLLTLMEHVFAIPSGVFRRASQVISFDPRLRACMQAFTTVAPTKRLIVSQEKGLKPWHRFFFPRECQVRNDSAQYRAEYFFDSIPGDNGMSFRPPRLAMPPKDWLMKKLPSEYVLIHPTSAWKRKCWLPEHWALTMNELEKRGIGPFVVTGGGEAWEIEHVRAIASIGGKLVNLAGKTTLTQYLAVVANAKAVLCIDGSSSHLAAAFGKPVITLFGPSSPLHWHFSTPNSKAIDARLYCPSEKRPAVSNIPPTAVINAFLTLSQHRDEENRIGAQVITTSHAKCS